jgi:hypothetical protein
MRHTLNAIAADIKSLPHNAQIEVCLGVSAEAVALLREMGAPLKSTVYDEDPPHTIDSAALEIDGVRFKAQARDRPPTDAEREALSVAKPSKPFRAVTMPLAVLYLWLASCGSPADCPPCPQGQTCKAVRAVVGPGMTAPAGYACQP